MSKFGQKVPNIITLIHEWMKVSTETQILSKEQVHFNGSIKCVNHKTKIEWKWENFNFWKCQVDFFMILVLDSYFCVFLQLF